MCQNNCTWIIPQILTNFIAAIAHWFRSIARSSAFAACRRQHRPRSSPARRITQVSNAFPSRALQKSCTWSVSMSAEPACSGCDGGPACCMAATIASWSTYMCATGRETKGSPRSLRYIVWPRAHGLETHERMTYSPARPGGPQLRREATRAGRPRRPVPRPPHPLASPPVAPAIPTPANTPQNSVGQQNHQMQPIRTREVSSPRRV